MQRWPSAADDLDVQTLHRGIDDRVRPRRGLEVTRSQAHGRTQRNAHVYVRVEGMAPVRLHRDQPILVGSHPEADLRLRDPYVSARQCSICLLRDGVLIVDENSKNGTFVDDLRIERVRVRTPATLRVGEQQLFIEAAQSATYAAEASTLSPIRMIGRSHAFRVLRDRIARLAPVRQPVLIRGETGTGKELAAKALHDASPRKRGPYVPVNCASIVDGLAESMLFGHVKGAFTGAHRDHIGAFARAHRGTLFLDEIAELPRALQAKLLRALETGRITPVGAEQEIEIDVRVVTATHRDVEAMIACGEFREDLFHRLGVLELELPPLRERRADIPDLLNHFGRMASAELGHVVGFTPEAIAAAQSHDWPGNIRALRNAVLRAGALADGPIDASALIGSSMPAAPLSGSMLPPRGNYDAMNRELLRRAVHEHQSIRQAAKALGVPRSTLGAWLKRLGIPIPGRSPQAPARQSDLGTPVAQPLRAARLTPR